MTAGWSATGPIVRERRRSVVLRVVLRVVRWARWHVAQAACWLFGCRSPEVVALVPEMFGGGFSGATWNGIEARCPRCGRVEYRDATLRPPDRMRERRGDR